MGSTVWEFFGFHPSDNSQAALNAASEKLCPFLGVTCEKTLSDGTISGACTLKQEKSAPVICCPIRLYADRYKILKDVTVQAFEDDLELIAGPDAVTHAKKTERGCVAVFGQRWGKELRLPQKAGSGSYFVDWVLARLDNSGNLVEFTAVEVQTIDTTGNYKNGLKALKENRKVVNTTAGLNWENVSKRILPQLVYKGQVLQREDLCKKGLFFVCPEPVYKKIMGRLGGEEKLLSCALQPASITFLVYNLESSLPDSKGAPISLRQVSTHTTSVFKLQEAFNNVALPEANVYRTAVLKGLEK